MRRKKIVLRRLKNPTDRKDAYTKREKKLVKKAEELSVKCNTDVALIMFSPVGSLTTFGSNGRVEDIFLRFLDTPNEQRGGSINNEEFLSAKMKQLKQEREMHEKIARLEDLEEKLDKLNLKRHQAQEKMRYYEPNLEKITSVLEVEVYERFLTSALKRIQLLKEKIQGNNLVPANTEAAFQEQRTRVLQHLELSP